jgi:hypothetical protein
MASPATLEILAEIKSAAAKGQSGICPAVFSWAFKNRAACSAAFRMARAQGIIEVAFISCAGTPVYQAAGTKQAAIEAADAVKH